MDAAEVDRLECEINSAIEQAREMAYGLNPAILISHGLKAALEELSRSMAKAFQLDCVCEYPQPVDLPDQDVALHLYRIAQEAMQNAVRHGKARHLVVRLSGHDLIGNMEILDDGVGLPANDFSPGMGLPNMRTRAQAIKGRLEVEPRPEGGTRVACIWPIPSRADSILNLS